MLCKIALLAVFVGAVLLAVGLITDILALTITGGCLIGAYVVFACVTYICALFDSIKKKEQAKGGSKKATEREMVEEINSSVGIKNETAVHARQAATVSNAVRKMGAADRFLVSFLIVLILCGIAAVVVLITKGYKLAAVCTAIGIIAFVGGFILIIQLAAKRSLGAVADDSFPPVFGKVVSCILYTEISKTTGENNAYHSTQKTRIISTVYKLRVRIILNNDGEGIGKSVTTDKVVSVFSENCYDEGEEVKLTRKRGSRRKYVVVG